MYEQTVITLNRAGAHSRPSALIVQVAARYKSNIILIKNCEIANAKSIMGVVTLGICHRDQVKIRADGIDEKEAVEALVKIFNDRFEDL